MRPPRLQATQSTIHPNPSGFLKIVSHISGDSAILKSTTVRQYRTLLRVHRMATLLRPGGSLLTLAFPLAPDEVAADPMAAGPPHPVSIAEYRRVLEPHGFKISAGPRPSAMSVAARAGTESVVWCHSMTNPPSRSNHPDVAPTIVRNETRCFLKLN